MANQQSGQGGNTGSGGSGGQNRSTSGGGGSGEFNLQYDRQSRQITIPSINESRSFSFDQFFGELRRAGIDEKDVTRWYEQNRSGGGSDQNRNQQGQQNR
jgi:hypothetical protein